MYIKDVAKQPPQSFLLFLIAQYDSVFMVVAASVVGELRHTSVIFAKGLAWSLRLVREVPPSVLWPCQSDPTISCLLYLAGQPDSAFTLDGSIGS